MEDKRKQMLDTLRAKALEAKKRREANSEPIPVSPKLQQLRERMKTINPQAIPTQMKRMSREELIERIKKLKKVE